MDDFSQKPKRKREGGRNTTLYLVGGIIIGVMVTALAAAGFLFVGTSTQTVDFFPTETPIPMDNAQAQSIQIQPTIIAHRVYSASLSPDGRFLATIVQEDMNTAIYLAELAVQRNLVANQRYTLQHEAGFFTDALFSPTGDKLVVTTEGGSTLIYDVQTRELLESLSTYSHAAFSPDGSMLALAGNGDGLRVLNAATLELVSSRQLSEPFIGGLAFNSRNQLAVAIQGQIQVWNPLDLQQVPNPYPMESPIFDIAFHPDGDWLAVASEGFVQLINITNSERKHYDFGTTRIHSVAFSPDGSWLAAGGGDSGIGEGKLFAFRLLQNDVIPPDPNFYDVVEFVGNNHIVDDVTFTHDGLLLSAAWDGSVRLWDVTTGEEISRLQL
jgi:WD40 repeat protein